MNCIKQTETCRKRLKLTAQEPFSLKTLLFISRVWSASINEGNILKRLLLATYADFHNEKKTTKWIPIHSNHSLKYFFLVNIKWQGYPIDLKWPLHDEHEHHWAHWSYWLHCLVYWLHSTVSKIGQQGFINIFSRSTEFRDKKNLPLDSQSRWAKSSSQTVNLHGARPLTRMCDSQFPLSSNPNYLWSMNN